MFLLNKFFRPNIWKIGMTVLLGSMLVAGFFLQQTSIVFQLILLIPGVILLPLLFGVLQPFFFSTGILDWEGPKTGMEDYVIMGVVILVYYYLFSCLLYLGFAKIARKNSGGAAL